MRRSSFYEVCILRSIFLALFASCCAERAYRRICWLGMANITLSMLILNPELFCLGAFLLVACSSMTFFILKNRAHCLVGLLVLACPHCDNGVAR